jgi:hypothetical protein
LTARYGDPTERNFAIALLADTDSEVRLRTAQGLLAAHDLRAVPTLISLMACDYTFIAWQAEELLFWLADDPKAPKAPNDCLAFGGPEAKKRCQELWQTWWDGTGRGTSLVRFGRAPRRPGLYLITESDRLGFHVGQSLTGCDDAAFRWHSHRRTKGRIEQFLDKDHMLMAESVVSPQLKFGLNERIGEYELGGRALWSYAVPAVEGLGEARDFPDVFCRFGGHYYVVGDSRCLLLVDNQGAILWKRENKLKPNSSYQPPIGKGMESGGGARLVLDDPAFPVAAKNDTVICRRRPKTYEALDVWTGVKLFDCPNFAEPSPGSLELRGGNRLHLTPGAGTLIETGRDGAKIWEKSASRDKCRISSAFPLLALGF